MSQSFVSSNEVLISILLSTGFRNNNVKELSSQILSKIKNIKSLSEISLNELIKIKGIGKAKALTIIAAIELGKRVSEYTLEDKIVLNNTSKVYMYFKNMIKNEKQENFLVVLIDNKNRLISYKIMYKGTSDSSLVSIKEIFNYAIRESASAIIVLHNHPSGIPSPSKEDIKLTNNLINSGKIIGIPLIDHLIIGNNNYYSFYNEMVK